MLDYTVMQMRKVNQEKGYLVEEFLTNSQNESCAELLFLSVGQKNRRIKNDHCKAVFGFMLNQTAAI